MKANPTLLQQRKIQTNCQCHQPPFPCHSRKFDKLVNQHYHTKPIGSPVCGQTRWFASKHSLFSPPLLLFFVFLLLPQFLCGKNYAEHSNSYENACYTGYPKEDHSIYKIAFYSSFSTSSRSRSLLGLCVPKLVESTRLINTSR